jgi:hypothetical protein
LIVITGKLSIPALGSVFVRERVPQPRLAERDPGASPGTGNISMA